MDDLWKVLAGVAVGITIAIVFMQYSSFTQIVRDEQGRIIQMLEMNDINLMGRRIVDVGYPAEVPKTKQA